MSYTDIFFSPHLDDALLSIGGLLGRLKKRRRSILVVSLFTTGSWPPYSLAAWRFLVHSGDWLARLHFHKRRREDAHLYEQLAINSVHAGLTDAFFRRNQSGKSLYRNQMELLGGTINPSDRSTIKVVGQIIRSTLAELAPKGTVYGPQGIGGHVDHLITRCALERQAARMSRLYLWQDLPYARNSSPQAGGTTCRLTDQELKQKLKYLSEYRSQSHIIQAIPVNSYRYEKLFLTRPAKNSRPC